MPFLWDDVTVEGLQFVVLPFEVIQDERLKSVLLQLENNTKEHEQKEFMKEILDFCNNKDNINSELIWSIMDLLIKYSSKKVLKKYLLDIITKNELTDVVIIHTVSHIFSAIQVHKICNIKLVTDFLNFIYIIQNSTTFNNDLNKYLFPLYVALYDGFVHQLKSNVTNVSSLLEMINIVLKQILSIFVRDVPYIKTVSEKFRTKLILLSHQVIVCEKVGFDIKTKAGLILAHSFQVVPEELLDSVKHKDCIALELLEEYNPEKKLLLGDHELSVFTECEQLVIIYGSILNVVPKEKMCQVKISDKTLLCLVYEGLLECAKKSTSISHLIVEISRTLSIISKHMKNVPAEHIEPLFVQGISFVWSHIEHFVDSVRNYTRQFFAELVVIAAIHNNNGCPQLLNNLIENIKLAGTKQKFKFVALELISSHIGCEYLLEQFKNLVEDLLKVISEPTISEEVCKTYMAMMEKHFQEIDAETWISTWITPPTRLLTICSHCTPLCQKIITRAFQLHPAVLRIVFPNDYIGNIQECGVLLKCLQYARQNGMELTMDNKENTSLYWRGLIDKEKLENFMIHQKEEIRVFVLAALVESQKTTEIFLNWELKYLLKYLCYNITSQIPHVRKQISSYYKKALFRFNAGSQVITRNIGLLKRKVEAGDTFQETLNALTVYQELGESYTKFLQHFTKYLIGNLTFDSNFPRRSISLELLLFIHCFVSVEQWQKFWTEDDVKNCHSILFDTYESNKKMAAILLHNLPFSHIGFTNVEFTFKYMQRCLNLALDIKPVKTVSAAYLLQVCAKSPFFYDVVQYDKETREQDHDPTLDMLVVLTGKLITQTNIEQDVVNKKVCCYGLFLSIRHILQSRDIRKNNKEYAGLFYHLTSLCLKLKDHIMPIVCNPSPEGYLPDSFEIINESDESTKAQMVLVYAWRSMKEMTLLLAELIRQTIKLEKECVTLPLSVMIKIGEFFWDVFITSKHKGVFEQAYVGFCVICDSFWRSSNQLLNCLPPIWLEDALMLCTGAKQSDKLCATRRSAGLPFLILSIISSEPVFDKSRFHFSITLLLDACKNVETENDEHRMHCMNVLRAMFRHSRLGEMVTAYIAQGVIVAITGFQSETWGVRNSATLLYAALITRMFGVQRTQDSDDLSLKNRLTVRVFFLRYPELFQFLLETLTNESSKSDSLLLHPVLMILARLYPSHFEEYNTQMDKYVPHLTTCLSNSVYRTRDLAAWATVPFIRSDQISSHLNSIFDRLSQSDVKDNETHGCLLLVLYIIRSNSTVPEIPISDYLEKTVKILQFAGKKFSHMTASLYLQLVMLILTKYPNYQDLDMLRNLVKILSRQITSNIEPVTSLSKYCQVRLSLLFYIVINKFEETDLTYSTVTNQIICQLYGHDLEMRKFCLNLLIYLNQVHTGYKHSLYQTEEIQIPPEVRFLGNTFDRKSIAKILTSTHQYLKKFLVEEIKHHQYVREEDQVLLFLLLNYYPCAIKCLNTNKQETLDMLLELCSCDNTEDVISAVISCISTFLLHLDYNVLKYEVLVAVLADSASPAASDFRRLAVCDFLAKNYILYCNEDSILITHDLHMVLHIILVLLEDDELIVRNAMSEFATVLKVKVFLGSCANKQQTISGKKWPVIAEKAREDLLNLSSIILPKDGAICFLFSWCCRHFPDSSSNDVSEVFERGELNSYAENIPFMDLCAEVLHKLLWTLEDGLSYEDKSIFIEEHTLLVTTMLLDALVKHSSPMMLYKTKVSVICALKSTVKFLERYEINTNFIDEFRTYLNETIIGYLTKQVEHNDLFHIKWIIKKIYDPVLRHKRPTV
ncbi:thyroid adenoma-associated protein homolog isoform X1 [Diabrotica virgifera virgifera]|uniref:tRNA (32-2'-O)-methyltransferase regulator THADA n=1 Tax=Diabrotica virgifera virgifera TaxID=50390 RepID=A0ABM5KDD7_DIAVI|nr:thyroid adenoma-associated protein homolog isoform X1 [Diabrotica virgifera virgifera]